ncbi:hypothetical protein L3Q82_014889, partial [Scortum barcoo]
AESTVETPCQTPGDEELFSQFLPESVMEDMFEQHGSWIRHIKIFQRAKTSWNPKQELKLSREVCWPLKDTLYEALPNTWLSREGLMEDVQIALLACSLIAAEIINCLKPTVRFAANTKPGDETPYSLNIPIPREEKEAERELTQLELHLQEQRAQERRSSLQRS